jgi:hypothetical protein
LSVREFRKTSKGKDENDTLRSITASSGYESKLCISGETARYPRLSPTEKISQERNSGLIIETRKAPAAKADGFLYYKLIYKFL